MARSIEVRILSMGLNTSDATDKLILTILGAVGPFERDLMLERQRYGIARAKALGKYKGRKPTARAKSDIIVLLRGEGRRIAEIAKEAGVSRGSVYRVLNAFQETRHSS